LTKCDCAERNGVEINSYGLFEELKTFFENQMENGIFSEKKVDTPYFIGYDSDGSAMKWYADKWYYCNCCGTLWEFTYPDFPAEGFVRKFSDGQYYAEE
jgi:hypothetical protein